MSAGDIIALAGLILTGLVGFATLVWGAGKAWGKLSAKKSDECPDDLLAEMQTQVKELHEWHDKPIREEDGTMVMSWEHSRDYRQAQKNMAETQALHTQILGGLLELVKELKKDADS